MTHLTAEEMQEYLVRRVSVDELGKLTEHLHECRTCYGAYLTVLQRRFPIEIDFEELGGLKGWHLQGQELADYVEGRMSELDFDYASLHLRECADCEQRVNDVLRGWVEHVPSTTRTTEKHRAPWRKYLPGLTSVSSPRWPLAAAFVLVSSLALILWAVVEHKMQEQPVAKGPVEKVSPRPTSSTETTPPNSSAPDANGATDHKAEGVAIGSTVPSHSNKARVDDRNEIEATLIARELVMPSSIERLDRTPPVVIRGNHPAVESFSIIEPYATLLATERPTFRWTSLIGAQSYTVSVYDEALHLVQASGPVLVTEWTIPKRLKSDIVYTWTVTALQDGKEITAPAAPRRAEFKMLGKTELAKLERRISGVASRAARGTLYAEAGLLADAESEFKTYLSRNPTDERVRKLLQTIKSWRGTN